MAYSPSLTVRRVLVVRVRAQQRASLVISSFSRSGSCSGAISLEPVVVECLTDMLDDSSFLPASASELNSMVSG